MTKGKTTDRETLYKVMLSYFMTRSYAATARELDMPESTVKDLVKRNIKEKEFVELWREKKEDFATMADVMIYKAMDKLNNELDNQKSIPINQLTTAIGTLYDKRRIESIGSIESATPDITINVVDNSNLEKALYEEENEED